MRLAILISFIALTGFALLAWASHIKHLREQRRALPMLDRTVPVRWDAQDWHRPMAWQDEPLVMNL